MSKTRNKSRRRQIMILCICGLGFSYGFTEASLSSFFDNIIKTTEQSRPIDQIFDGKVSTDNLYKKALTMVKTETANTVKDSIQSVVKTINEESNTSVDPQDVLNIVYDSAISTKKIASVGDFVNESTKLKGNKNWIGSKEILASYTKLSKKIKSCINTANLEERVCIKRRISEQYQVAEQGYVDQNSFTEDTYGEDLFANGTTDDSSYDILVDIKNISKILFTSFIGPTETLFYRLPKSNTTAIKNTFAAILNAVNGTSGEEITGTGSASNSGSTNTGTNNGNRQNGIDANTNNGANVQNDASIAGFINKTNTTSKTTTTTSTSTSSSTKLAGITQGNICLPSVSAGPSKTTTTETETTSTTIQEYLDEIDKKSDGTLPTNAYTNQGNIGDGVNEINDTSSPGDLAIMNQLIEAKINTIFDATGTKTCTETCSVSATQKRQSCTDQSKAQKVVCDAMPYVDKVICNKNRIDSEVTCKEPIIAEETMCTIECLCFTNQYPKAGLGLEGVDGQLKVRFCSIPVQQNRISKAKDILGRDDSLSRIKSVFENLLNGGEMIKYERNKEFLDSPLGAIKRDKFIAFDFNMYFKGLFESTNKTARKTEAQKTTKTIENNSKGEPNSNATRNQNKIIMDSAMTTANQEVSMTYSSFQEETQKATDTLAASQTKTFEKELLTNSKNTKNIIFNEQMNAFLEKNNEIRSAISKEILSFKALSKALNSAIHSAQ